MAAPIDLRSDFALSVSTAAPREEDQGRDPEPSSAWRWPRSTIRGSQVRMQSRIGGVGLQIIRDWVLMLQTPDGLDSRLVDGKSPGRHQIRSFEKRRSLAAHWRRLLRPAR